MKYLISLAFICLMFSGTNAQPCELNSSAWKKYAGVYRIKGASVNLFAVTNSERKTGIIDANGKIVVPAIYMSFGKPEKDKIIGEVAKHSYQVVDLHDGSRKQFPYPLLSKDIHDGTILASVDSKTQLMDVNGNVLIKAGIYADILDAGCGRATVTRNGMFGYADYAGELIVPCKYADTETMVDNSGIVVLEKEDQQLYGVIDVDGKRDYPGNI